MKRLTAVLLAGLLAGGCGPSKEAMDAYYQQLQLSNQAIVDSINRQADENRLARTQQRLHFSQAMSAAAATESQTDDVVVAYAWGYQAGQPYDVEIPELATPRPPETSSEKLRAWTPVIGMAVPFLYPLVYGWANSGSGSVKVSASDNARVAMDSNNAGSYNKAGRDINQSGGSTDSGDCENCDTPVGIGGEVVPEVCADYPDAVQIGGTWFIDPTSGCSCNSAAEGRCGPA